MAMKLRPATNRMAYAKIGIYGNAGSGKTFTASKMAIGLHKRINSKKPVVIFDTEPAFSFVKPLFDKAGIDLLICDESRSLKDLMEFMNEAEKISDIVIIDSITHVWREAQESFLKRINANKKYPIMSLEFHHWRPIKAAWAEFTDRFLSSKMHAIVCGRAGSIYEYQEKNDGSGKKELITNGTRMATEKELGYEPSLLFEMIADRRDGKIINMACIQKDRSDTINGDVIEKPDFEDFQKHFECLNLGGEHFDSMEKADSTELYSEYDQSGFDKIKQDRTIQCENIEEHIKKIHPSQSVQDKQGRADLLEKYFNTRSWTKISQTIHPEELKRAYEKMISDFFDQGSSYATTASTAEKEEDVQC